MSVTELDNSPYTDSGAYAEGSHGGETFSSEIDGDDFGWDLPDEDNHAQKKGLGRSIRKQDIAEITSQLAIMTRSGVNIASALESLANQCRRPALASVLHDVHESVLACNPLSTA
jgi:hypothetical protein